MTASQADGELDKAMAALTVYEKQRASTLAQATDNSAKLAALGTEFADLAAYITALGASPTGHELAQKERWETAVAERDTTKAIFDAVVTAATPS